MYLQILKKDLKRKKTMNLILFIFIILASTFIAGSVSNMVSVITALDVFFERAEVPDHLLCFGNAAQAGQFQEFAQKEHYRIRQQQAIQIDPKLIEKEDGETEYSNTAVLSRTGNSVRIFDQDDQEITQVEDGMVYFSLHVLEAEDLKPGDRIGITANGKTRRFTVAGSVKDAVFASDMAGMTRIFVSDSDYSYFQTDHADYLYITCIDTEDEEFQDKFNRLGVQVLMDVDRSELRLLYIMDMVIAAVMLTVSVCLILISMVILRFTIHFTMSEEFREIGVMKAIGIPNWKIRGLYIVKYLAISIAGAGLGLIFSIPFGKLLSGSLSRNIMIETEGNAAWNLLCAFAVAGIVVLFSYLCTRRIKSFSPMDAIRNGENGERYARKSVLSLNRSYLPAVLFLALNDIFSSMRRYAAMILIFTIGILLVIIPVNTMNTLESDHLITWFSMAECDHVIGREQLFHSSSSNRQLIVKQLDEIRDKLSQNGISAKVFQEAAFRMLISYQDRQESSLAFQGAGDVTADDYVYLEGSAPQDCGEVGISHLIAEKLGVQTGDTVCIKNGDTSAKYMVTAIFQTMNNMGEGIRFYEKEQLDYAYVFGSFGVQLRYTDSPDSNELEKRKELLKELFADYEVYTAGEYISEMTGDISGQMKGMKQLILAVVLCINILVTVLMVKSFLAKEKGEIAMLKAIGFGNLSLALWQALRIGIVLFLAAVIGTVLSTPLSQVSVGPVFRIMGAQSIEFEIKPLEVYVMYPLLVFTVTVLAGMASALQVRKIPATDASSME